MRKKKFEKVLVLLLSLCMIVQPLPVNAYADETAQITTYYVGGPNASYANDGLSSSAPLVTVASAASRINTAGAGNYKIIIQEATDERHEIVIGDNVSYINITIVGADYMKPDDAATGSALSNIATGSAIILRDQLNSSDLFTVKKNATLTLGDSTGDSNAKLYLDGGNYTHDFGRLVNVEEGGTLNIYSNVTLRNNKVSNIDNLGGAVYNNGTAMINGGVITGNSSDKGAAIFNYGTLIIKNGSINNNKSKNGTINTNGNCQISGGTISNNTSENGAGIYSNGSLTITGGMITDNIASKQGGGIYNEETLTISGGSILNNSATEEGGGIYNEETLSITGAVIKDNSSKKAGGAVYNYQLANFSMSGNIVMPSDGKINDVAAQHINIKGVLTCSEPFLITQKPYMQGTKLLMGSSDDIAAAVSCFQLKDSNFKINSSGIIEYIGAPITYYVGGADAKEGNDGKSPSTPFINLAQAVEANAGGTCTIIIQGDTVLTDMVDFYGNITLETDGTAHSISCSTSNAGLAWSTFITVVSGELNLGNTSNTGSDLLLIKPNDNTPELSTLICIDREAILNINSETTIKGWHNGADLIDNSGKLNISGGIISGNDFSAIIYNDNEMNMTGGRISGNTAIGIDNEMNCNISGGTLDNNTKGEILSVSHEVFQDTLSLSNKAKIVTGKEEPFCIMLGGINSSVKIADNIEADNNYTITYNYYINGLTALTGTDDLIKANLKHFTLANADYKIDPSGKIICLKEGKTYYVGSMQAGLASDSNTGTDKEHPFATLEKALAAIDTGVGTIIIQSNLTIDQTLVNNGDTTILSNGVKHTILRSNNVTDDMIKNEGSLTFGNKDNSGNDNKPDLILDGNKSVIQANGSILRNNGLVYLYSGVSFENNYSKNRYSAGGIINTGICNMYGGSIHNNGGDATKIGGVNCIGNSTFTMNGGSIRNNMGIFAGVFVDDASNFKMNGGEVISNSGSNMAGIVVFEIGTFIMNGGTVSGNSGRCAGIAVNGHYYSSNVPKTTLKLNGGMISNNNGEISGVLVSGNNINLGISGDIAIADGDRFYVASDNGYPLINIEGTLTGKSQEFNLSYIIPDKVDNSYYEEFPVGAKILTSTSGYSAKEQDLAKFKLGNQDYTINRQGCYSKAIKDSWVKISDDSNIVEDGKPKTVTVSASDGKTVLTAGTDYIVSYSNNISAGTATVKITGIGNYGASVIKTFKIKPVPIKPTTEPATPTAKPTTAPVSPTPTSAPVVLPDNNNTASTPIPTAAPTAVPTASPSSSVSDMDAKISDQTDNKGRHIISVPEDKLQEKLHDKGITNVNLNVTAQSDDTDLIIKDELLKAAKDNGKDLSVAVKDNTGKVRYRWEFNKDNLKDSGNNLQNVNLYLDVSTVKDNLPEISDGKGLVINFGQEGQLPAQAAVKIYVGDQQDIKPGEKIYLYHWNKSSNKLEALPYSDNYIVDADGYITINIVHCSDYVILTHPAPKSITTGLTDQISATVNKKVITLNKDKKAKVSLKLPSTLELVASLKDKTSQSAIGGATVAYSSSNKKVVTVNKDGVITAVGKGKATITTTITLYNKKKKKIRTSIKVTAGA